MKPFRHVPSITFPCPSPLFPFHAVPSPHLASPLSFSLFLSPSSFLLSFAFLFILSRSLPLPLSSLSSPSSLPPPLLFPFPLTFFPLPLSLYSPSLFIPLTFPSIPFTPFFPLSPTLLFPSSPTLLSSHSPLPPAPSPLPLSLSYSTPSLSFLIPLPLSSPHALTQHTTSTTPPSLLSPLHSPSVPMTSQRHQRYALVRLMSRARGRRAA